MSRATSEALIARAKTGDRSAFDELIVLYQPSLQAVIHKRLGAALKPQAGVDDILQETYLRAFLAIDRFEWQGEGSFFRWLSGIAVKVILEIANREKHTGSVPLDLEIPARESSPSKVLQREERYRRFEKAIASLSPDYRDVLRLVRLEGLSVTEVAKQLNRSPHAVSQLLLRALKKLRQSFKRTGSLRLRKPGGESAGKEDSSDD